MFKALKKVFGSKDKPPPQVPVPSSYMEPEPIVVPEIDAATLMAIRSEGQHPLILDCREPWEWKQARIPDARHIPMNETPERLAELNPEQEIVVVCAHGQRSYGVAGFLIERGFSATNLVGGMASWQGVGGEVESDYSMR